jgi:hypothetical protein
MRCLLHVLQARGAGLVVGRFGRYMHAPMGDHDGHAARGDLFTSMAHNL